MTNAMPRAAIGNVTTAAAIIVRATSSGTTNRGGTRTVFTDNVGIRLINSAATATVQTITTGVLDHQPSRSNSRDTTSGSNASNPPAGAGTPTKNSLAYGGWSASSSRVLNRANRRIMHTAKTSAKIQPTRLLSPSFQWYSTSAGATPNAIASDSESSSAPILLVASSSRAIRPSRLSRMAAANSDASTAL